MRCTRQELHEMNEQRIRDLRATWEEEMAGKLRAAEDEHAKTLADKVEHHVHALEQDRARAVKLEASKWKQALKEAEKRLALEVKQAHERGRDERDAEAQAEIAALEAQHRQTIAAMDGQTDAAVRAAEARFREEFKTLDAANVALRKAAAEQAEKDTTERLNAEWAKKLVTEMESAVEKAEAVNKVKLAKQQEALEDFKRDMQAQAQRIADERNELQRHFMDSSQAAERLQIERRTELNRMRQDFEEEREQYRRETETKHKRELEQLRLKLRNEAADEQEEKEAAFTKRMEFERRQAVEKAEARLEQVHRDSIRQIDALEARVADLERENAAATAEATTAARAARVAEDKLLQAEAAERRRGKEASLHAWRMAAGAVRLRHESDGITAELKARYAKEDAKMRAVVQKDLGAFALATTKLARLLLNAEDMRKRMDESLRSYRVDDLNERRRRIKVRPNV